MIRSAFIYSLTMVLVFATSAAAQPAKKDVPWRIALICASSSATMNNLLDLAEAKLSADDGLVLLDRKAVSKLLAEQKLSLSGLVDSNFAVNTGKLLNANVFALVEADPLGKEALGLVIYDADAGIKWHDATLAAGTLDQQVEAIAQAVRGVAKKRAVLPKSLQTVCVLGTRNADLPRAQDHVAPTVAWLLERHLLASPSLVVLERKRLDRVNQEKALTGSQKELLASLVSVEIEISRADKGIRATAHLTDPQGKDLGKIRAESASASAEELAKGLLAGVVRSLQAAPIGAAPDRRREGQRFFLEGQRLFTHGQWPQAVRALEAAHALNPEDVPTHVHLTHVLIEGGVGSYDLQKGLDRRYTADEIKVAFRAALRAYELRRGAMEKGPLDTLGLRAYGTMSSKTLYLNLWLLKKDLIDDECRELIQQAKTAYVSMATAECKQAAHAMEYGVLLARKGPPPQYQDLGTLYFGYSVRLKWMMLALGDFPGISVAEQETVALEWLQIWLAVTRHPDLFPHFDHANRMFASPYRFGNAPRLLPFYQSMSQHPNPLLQLWGKFYTLHVERHQRKMTPAEADKAFQDSRTSALLRMDEVNVAKAPRFSK